MNTQGFYDAAALALILSVTLAGGYLGSKILEAFRQWRKAGE